MSTVAPNRPARAPAQRRGLPTHIGRFAVDRVLGTGSQGMVLLARDEDLAREVAIKVLRVDSETADSAQLMEEARIVSGLQHPNVVTLYEVGQFRKLPYLVFEYVRGRSIADLLETDGALPFATAVIYMSQILGGVARVHDSQIAHGDLCPANILISEDGTPKVADFGLSTRCRESGGDAQVVRGTLRYMAPETLQGAAPTPCSDVFALGALFHEMIVGRKLLAGENKALVADAILNGPVRTPADEGVDLPPEVEAVFRASLSRDPATRYESARPMKTELDRYRVPRSPGKGQAEDAPPTFDFMLRRITYVKGFSALSGRISEVLDLTSSDSVASSQQLANVLAKDPTLAQRVLAMASSARPAAGMTNISRAIVRLGMERVRACVTRTLVEGQVGAGSPEILGLIVRSFFAASFAKELVGLRCPRRREDTYLCALFHDLGRTLVTHYLTVETEVIRECVASEGIDVITASRRVLGAPYHEFGMRIAETWQLPPLMRASMRPIPRGTATPPADEDALIAFVAAFANAVTETLATNPAETAVEELRGLAGRASPAVSLEVDEWEETLGQAATLTAKYARLIGADVGAESAARRLEAAASIAAGLAPPEGDEAP